MNRSENSEEQVSVSRYLISRIKELNVNTVPVFQGGCSMKLIDEIGETADISYIVPYHEQALAIMVEAYARFRGFGVGIVTSGPGGTNLITGICCAFYDSIPCLFITGQVGMIHMKGKRSVRQRGFQETDIVSVVEPVTKYATVLDDPLDTRYIFEKAVYLAKSGRPGPVLIDLPYNVQRAMIEPDELRGFFPSEKDLLPPEDLTAQVTKVVALLREADRPVLLIGGGVRLAKQENDVIKLVEALKIPVVSTWAAVDIFDHDHPLFIGSAGRNGNPSAIELIQESDCLLGLGTRFPLKVIFDENEFAKNANTIAVDIDKGVLTDGLFSADLKIHCDLRYFVPELLRQQTEFANQALQIDHWTERARQYKNDMYKVDVTIDDYTYISPYRFMDALSNELPQDAILVADAGANVTWAGQTYRAKLGQRFFSSWGNSPMGYSLAAAIGAYYATKDENRPVVAIIGDGGLQMNIQELQTIAVNDVPIKIFVLNNRCLGNTIHGAFSQFDGRTHGNDPDTGYEAPDFIKIVEAYGIESLSLNSEECLQLNIREILSRPGSLLIDVRIDSKQGVYEHEGIHSQEFEV